MLFLFYLTRLFFQEISVAGLGEAEVGTIWSPISGVSRAEDKDITAALQEAVDKHEPLKSSVCKSSAPMRAQAFVSIYVPIVTIKSSFRDSVWRLRYLLRSEAPKRQPKVRHS